MKTVEEWDVTHAGMSSLEFIEAIQLDAMKEGMRRAANMTSQHHMETLIQQQEMRQAILTTVEQLTEKDL